METRKYTVNGCPNFVRSPICTSVSKIVFIHVNMFDKSSTHKSDVTSLLTNHSGSKIPFEVRYSYCCFCCRYYYQFFFLRQLLSYLYLELPDIVNHLWGFIFLVKKGETFKSSFCLYFSSRQATKFQETNIRKKLSIKKIMYQNITFVLASNLFTATFQSFLLLLTFLIHCVSF